MAATTMAKVSTSVVATPSIHANRAPSALSSAASFRTAALSSKLSALALKTSASSNSSSSSGSAVVRVRADATAAPERFRLNNLSPQDGSRRKNKRKGRGYGAGQGGSCGFGMRGQKSRSGPGVRPGFEGGQMPLYRRLPKLKGIAGGMGAGLPKYVAINLADLNELDVADGAEVSLDTLKALRVLNPSGRDRTLPLKVLGDGEITRKLTVKAASFSSAAREKLEAAGCTVVEEPRKTKWLGAAALKRKERLEEFIASKQQ